MTELAIHLEWNGDAVHLQLEGELDIDSADEVAARIAAVQESSARVLLIDLAGVGFIDSTGLRVLLAAQRSAEEGGVEVLVVRPQRAVRQVLGITGADSVLQVVNGPRERG